MSADWSRRERNIRTVEYVLQCPATAKDMGIVLAQLHRELGSRINADNAYEVISEDDAIVFRFEVQSAFGSTLQEGDSVTVSLSPTEFAKTGTVVGMGGQLYVTVPAE